MVEFKLDKLENLSNKGIKSLLVEGSNPFISAIGWAKYNNYSIASIADIYTLSGLEGLEILKDFKNISHEKISDERRYGYQSPTRVESYLFFNSFYVSKQVKDTEKLSDEEFSKMNWLKTYIIHNPEIDYSSLKEDNRIGIPIDENLLGNAKEMQDIFKFEGAPWMDICWLDGSLLKNQNAIEQLYGKPIENYEEQIINSNNSDSKILVLPPYKDLVGRPICFGGRIGHAFTEGFFWYKAHDKNSSSRVDRLNFFPVIKND